MQDQVFQFQFRIQCHGISTGSTSGNIECLVFYRIGKYCGPGAIGVWQFDMEIFHIIKPQRTMRQCKTILCGIINAEKQQISFTGTLPYRKHDLVLPGDRRYIFACSRFSEKRKCLAICRVIEWRLDQIIACCSDMERYSCPADFRYGEIWQGILQKTVFFQPSLKKRVKGCIELLVDRNVMKTCLRSSDCTLR